MYVSARVEYVLLCHNLWRRDTIMSDDTAAAAWRSYRDNFSAIATRVSKCCIATLHAALGRVVREPVSRQCEVGDGDHTLDL